MYSYKLLCELLIFIIVATFTIVVGVDNDKFSVCGPTTTSDDSSPSLIFVTTLDGKVTALDSGKNGEKKWTIDFDEEPLISSSIHHRELNNDGYWVRLIPSLNGGLYKFNGEKIERVPVSTDQLLKSSYRYSDDLVFSGGKETRSYGVSSKTGRILYQCNMNGCSNTTEDNSYIEPEDILIIKRYQQIVRAIEPRTGLEKWNYSVGQHELVLIPHENRGCNNNKLNENNLDIELKAVVPDGVVWAMNKKDPTIKLWKHQFDSPIVSIWRENNPVEGEESVNKLEQMNLFNSTQYLWGVEFTISPSLYIGMHSNQLYLQENINDVNVFELSSESMAVYPWQPYPAIEKAIAFRGDGHDTPDEENDYDGPFLSYYQPQATALSVLYNSRYINGLGYYLYTEDQTKNLNKCNQTDPNIPAIEDESVIDDADDDKINNESNVETSIQIIITSLWYWWREVTIISITTAFLLNYFLTQRLLNATTPTNDAVAAPIIVERHVEMKAAEDETVKISISEPTTEFHSRYLSDFMPINCLGKGGYGVVFEAKNIIDDCNYAIKRIALPNSKDSRDRVMREVKALAKLDHHNIVRYFHAWLECPPAGWQEQHDQMYINKQLLTPSQCPTTTTATTTDNNTRNTQDKSNVVCIDVSSSNRSSVDSAIEAVELNYINDEDSSFIIFDASHSDESVMTEEYEDDLSSSSDSENMNNNSLNDDINDMAHSMSIEFKNSTGCSIEFKNSTGCSIEFKNSTGCSIKCDKSSSMKARERKKSENKKTPKMFLYIQMQLCQRSSLREWLKRESLCRDYSRIVNIFRQIVDAVEYVHLQGLIHRDLKPSNIFFAYDDKVKIGDFGLVTAIPEGCNGHKPCVPNGDNIYIHNCDPIVSKNCNHTACVGTKLYMSPEQMNEQVYDYKVDIYSLGIILFELLMPFNTEMERIMALMDLRKSIYPKDFAAKHPNEYGLLRMMLDDDPNKRPTTLGVKARPPLLNCGTVDESTIDDGKWHFELPRLSRHSSGSALTNSSSNDSWVNSSIL